jgi:MFS family permease
VALVLLFLAAQLMRRDPGGPAHAAQPAGGSTPTPRADAAPDMMYRHALRSPTMWMLCGSQFLVTSCLTTITVHIVPHAVDMGFERTTAASLLACIGGISLLGRVAVGTSIDRIGGRRALLASYVLLFTSMIWLQYADVPWMLFVFTAGYGIAHGGFLTGMSPTVAEYFGTRAHGTVFGTVLFCGSLGGAAGPFAAGAMFDAFGSYRIAFGALCILTLAGFTVVSRLAPHQPRHHS